MNIRISNIILIYSCPDSQSYWVIYLDFYIHIFLSVVYVSHASTKSLEIDSQPTRLVDTILEKIS